MRAMVFRGAGQPLAPEDRAVPAPGPGQLLLRVEACAVCRTDLHIIDGELPNPKPELIPGHEIVAEVVGQGTEVTAPRTGERVGVPWLGWTCGECGQCRAGRENLCPRAGFTGYTLDGGYADYAVADARYCFPLPHAPEPASLAPLLCAGLIGYRAYRQCGEGVRRLGLYGFGAAAHILCQLAVHEGCEVYAFTRPGDDAAAAFARRLGAVWAGDSRSAPPRTLDAAIIFAPVGALVVEALQRVRPGGTVVCGGIHMSDIPSFPYRLLWEERQLRSVANLTRRDGEEFLARAPAAGIRTETVPYGLEEADSALEALRAGRLTGAAVLLP